MIDIFVLYEVKWTYRTILIQKRSLAGVHLVEHAQHPIARYFMETQDWNNCDKCLLRMVNVSHF